VGRTIVRSGQNEFKVIGVMDDFHYASVKQKIAPLMLLLGNNHGGLIVKIKTPVVKDFLANLKSEWVTFHANGPLSYFFLDENFARLYDSEIRTEKIFAVFAVIAIVIASLGLFGLSAYVMEQRTKEIGIRKVLGATVLNVLLLVSREFLLLVCLACLIAIPAAYWAMSFWLRDFAYRANIGGWIFLVAAMLAIFVALATISFQAIKAAKANPVKSLKAE
jgi:putative ABC transport system permease protein